MGSRTLSMKRNYSHAAVVTGNARTCLWHLLNYSIWQRGYYRIWVLLLSVHTSKLESDVCCRLQVAPPGERYGGNRRPGRKQRQTTAE